MKHNKKIGIIGAMANETEHLQKLLQSTKPEKIGDLLYFIGELAGHTVIVVKCGVGKVNAARCTQLLIDHYNPDIIINTGIAGGISPELNVGDLVIGTGFVQHDFDVTAFGHAHGYPCTGEDDTKPTIFQSDERLIHPLKSAATEVIPKEKIREGLIATGDRFVSDPDEKKKIRELFGAVAVEMEGGAIAQTACFDQTPFVAVRTISDLADGSAAESFDVFEKDTAALSAAVIKKFLKNIGGIHHGKL